jgi:hypothetical protein
MNMWKYNQLITFNKYYYDQFSNWYSLDYKDVNYAS